MDVTDTTHIAALPEAIRRTLGRVDILVNNAGTGTYKPFLEVTDEELMYGTINFFAQVRICQRVVPMMVAQGARSWGLPSRMPGRWPRRVRERRGGDAGACARDDGAARRRRPAPP